MWVGRPSRVPQFKEKPFFALSKGKPSLDVLLENRQAMRFLLMTIVNSPQRKKFLKRSQFGAMCPELCAQEKGDVGVKSQKRAALCLLLNWICSLGYAVCAAMLPDFAMKQSGLSQRIKTSPWSPASPNWGRLPPAREVAGLFIATLLFKIETVE